ncbi:MAG: histidine phosphatase family protein [Firmicutes bacterium]|nr:histidine phosphatase family protein [Bacillota bacterium]
MELYVVRHGETNENIKHMMQGNMDTVLNETGRNQALGVRKKIENIKIDLIISSPKLRALETAQIISNGQIPIITDERLLSRNHGEFQGKSRYDIDIENYWNIKKNEQYETAESVSHMFERIIDLLNDIKKNYSDKTVMLATHSGVCRILYYYFNGIPESGSLLGYESVNCSLEKYELGE